MSDKATLTNIMLARADKDGLEKDHPLRQMADLFDSRANQFLKGEINAKQFVNTWARARRMWRDYSGEPLI